MTENKETIEEERYTTIVKTADHIASLLLIQLHNSNPEGSTALQLGLVKTLSILWSSQARIPPEPIFDKIIAAIPDILKGCGDIVH